MSLGCGILFHRCVFWQSIHLISKLHSTIQKVKCFYGKVSIVSKIVPLRQTICQKLLLPLPQMHLMMLLLHGNALIQKTWQSVSLYSLGKHGIFTLDEFVGKLTKLKLISSFIMIQRKSLQAILRLLLLWQMTSPQGSNLANVSSMPLTSLIWA